MGVAMARGLPVAWLLVILVAASCAAPQSPGPSQGARDLAARPGGPKRVSASVTANLTSLRSQLSRAAGGTLPGARELEQLVHAGLAVEDDRGDLRPQLAEAVPTVENGLWKVFDDGRMETTWRIRPNAEWHDGGGFTTGDLLFTAKVAQDRDLPLFRHLAYDSIDGVEAPDPRTLTIRWSRPFIEADTMFSGVGSFQAVPLPRHLLEGPYIENKAGFMNLAYWGEEFVGAGPFKLREWVQGSHLVLEAYDRYILGRPKVDEIEVKFVPDPNTLVANILAGAVELPVGRGLSFEQTVQVRDQWRGGRVEFTPGGSIKVWPQLNNPNPAVIGDVRFRRALFHAIDRQQLVDTLMLGLSSVAHSVLIPTDREYPALQASEVRYEYDPRKASQMVEGLGYLKGADGFFRDAAGQRLTVEIRATVIDILQKTVLAIGDDWQRIGVAAEPHTITPGRQSDREYRATFPGFDTSRGNNSVATFKTFLSSEARVRATGYAGQNYPSYMNAELDSLIDGYLLTIPVPERMRVAGRVVHHLTDQAVVMPTFYDVTGTMTGNRLTGVSTSVGQGRTTTWNAHEWDVM